MEIYAGSRKSGKTFSLIERSSETGIPILVTNNKMKEFVQGFAKRMGKTNISIITIHEIKSRPQDKVLVDDADRILSVLLKTKIAGMSATATNLVDLGPTKPFEVQERVNE